MNKILLVVTLFVSTIAFAGRDHFHPKKVAKCDGSTCTEEQIKASVPAAVKELANWKQIDPKWESAKIENIEFKEFSKKGKTLKTWVVALVEDKIQDSSKNKVYLYFLEDGSIFRTNTTGVLK